MSDVSQDRSSQGSAFGEFTLNDIGPHVDGNHRPKWLKPREQKLPCDSVRREDMNTCWEDQTRVQSGLINLLSNSVEVILFRLGGLSDLVFVFIG